MPGVPIVSSSLPCGLNFSTVWPLPAAFGNLAISAGVAERASTTQTLPCLSTSMPCGHMMRPAPNCATTLPDGSSLTIGFTVEPAQELLPQRSPAHSDLPSTSMATALTEPHERPSGSVPKFRTVS